MKVLPLLPADSAGVNDEPQGAANPALDHDVALARGVREPKEIFALRL